eukprot:scaffold25962_cov20-Tisochrysis_lutea.AAC.3
MTAMHGLSLAESLAIANKQAEASGTWPRMRRMLRHPDYLLAASRLTFASPMSSPFCWAPKESSSTLVASPTSASFSTAGAMLVTACMPAALPPLSADRHNTGHILHACSPVHRASKQGASMERGSSTSTPSSLSTAGRCNSDTCGPAPVRKHVRERDVKGKCPLNVLSPRHSGGKPSQTILWDNTSCSLDTLAALVAESLGKLVALFLEQAGEQSDIAWKQAGDETRKASDDLKWKHAGFSTNKERDQL